MSTLIVQAVLRTALRRGLDRGLLLEEVGLDPRDVSELQPALPSARMDALWHAASLHAGTTFGLEVAQRLERGSLRGLEYAIRASATLADGMRMLARFTRILQPTDGYQLRTEYDGSVTLLYIAPHTEEAEQVAVDFALSAAMSILRDATGIRWKPRRVRFRHVEVRELANYAEFFDAPIQLHQPENALVVGPELLALPMREADPALCAVLERYLVSELETIEPAQSLGDMIAGVILDGLPEQKTDLDSVALRVGLSPRVLQKRLQQTGTSFQALLDRVRQTVAKRYLLQPAVSLAVAARELGYSDVTAFHRAFKRWTGLTPGEFRRRAGRGDAGD